MHRVHENIAWTEEYEALRRWQRNAYVAALTERTREQAIKLADLDLNARLNTPASLELFQHCRLRGEYDSNFEDFQDYWNRLNPKEKLRIVTCFRYEAARHGGRSGKE